MKTNMKKALLIIAMATVLTGCAALKASAQAVDVQDIQTGAAQDLPQWPLPDLMFDLWPDGAPTSNGLTGEEIDYGNHVSNVTKPTLAVYLPEEPNGLAILVCPGGGYVDVWDKTEGYFNSRWFTEQGIVYAVLKYRLPNGHPEVPLDDVHEAMRILWDHAEEYGFDKLGIAGCSAGGHLAATASTHFTKPEERPDFTILFYPVITMDPSFTHGGSMYYLLGREPSQALLDKYSYAHQSARIAWAVLGTPEVMRELESLMQEAERLADTPQAKARVANWRTGIFDYMRQGAADWQKKTAK